MARCHFATWEGDNLPNKTKGSMWGHKGLVLHADAVDNIDADNNWFHNPKAEASAHFGVRNDGELVQWVDTDDTAWAEVAGNHYWVSVEIESKGEPATQAQVETLAKLFAWLSTLYKFPVHSTSEVDGSGLGHHSMGGDEWGGHTLCPGQRILDQKHEIVHRARQLLDFPIDHPGHPCHQQDEKKDGKPAEERKSDGSPDWYHRVLSYKPGEKLMSGDDVKHVQRLVHVADDGFYGPNTVAKVRGFQSLNKLKTTGNVNVATARKLDEKR